MTPSLWKSRRLSTENGRRTYNQTTRGRPASRRIPSPPGCLPRVTLRRSAVTNMHLRDVDGWARLLRYERALVRRFLWLLENKRDPSITARRWWAAVAEILNEMRLMGEAGLPLHWSPDEMLRTMSGLAGYLAAGIVPDPVKIVARRGKPAVGPMESEHLSYATAYLQLCAEGIIEDATPILTVCSYFDVKRQTAQGWKARPIIRAVQQKMHDPSVITACMKGAGAYYRQAQRRRKVGKRQSNPDI